MAELRLQGLTKAYNGRAAVRALDLTVADGELLALLGPSGSGKTTLLRLISGLERPEAGAILLGARDVTRLDPAARDVGMVFQGSALFPHLTVRRNIAYGLQARGRPEREVAPLVDDAARRLGLADLLDRRPGRLSGGERQRVALARALVRSPAVLLLDEPLSSLDAPLRAELRREIARLRGALELTIVHVTHDQGEALALGDRVGVLREGVLEQVGTPEELYSRPATLAVARFVGVAQMSVLAPGAVPELAGSAPAAVLGVRPEDVRLVAEAAAGAVRLATHVELVEPGGDHALVTLALAGGATLTARIAADARPQVGERLEVAVDAARVHRFDADTHQRLP